MSAPVLATSSSACPSRSQLRMSSAPPGMWVPDRVVDESGQVDVLAPMIEVLAASQGEQALDDTLGLRDHGPDVVCHRLQLLGAAAPGLGHDDVDGGASHREGRAQFMRRVCDEATLGVEGRLEPVHHRVECHSEFGDLGARTLYRESFGELVAGDAPGRAGRCPRAHPPGRH